MIKSQYLRDKIFGLNFEGLKSLTKEMEVRETTFVSTISKMGKDKEFWAGPRVITFETQSEYLMQV